MSSVNYEENGYKHKLDLLIISNWTCVFYILLYVGAERELSIIDPLTLYQCTKCKIVSKRAMSSEIALKQEPCSHMKLKFVRYYNIYLSCK